MMADDRRRKTAKAGRGRSKSKPAAASVVAKLRRQPARCNALDGKKWLQNSISVWGDVRKSPEELRLKHPAMFPLMLAERLIESFLPNGSHLVLDPFCGTGSTLVAADRLGK